MSPLSPSFPTMQPSSAFEPPSPRANLHDHFTVPSKSGQLPGPFRLSQPLSVFGSRTSDMREERFSPPRNLNKNSVRSFNNMQHAIYNPLSAIHPALRRSKNEKSPTQFVPDLVPESLAEYQRAVLQLKPDTIAESNGYIASRCSFKLDALYAAKSNRHSLELMYYSTSDNSTDSDPNNTLICTEILRVQTGLSS